MLRELGFYIPFSASVYGGAMELEALARRKAARSNLGPVEQWVLSHPSCTAYATRDDMGRGIEVTFVATYDDSVEEPPDVTA